MFRSPDFTIVKYRKFTYLLSAAIIVAGIVSILLQGGLRMGIDFAGGNILRVEVTTEDVDIADVRNVLVETGYGNDVQRIDDPVKNLFLLRTRAYERDNDRVISDIKNALIEEFGESNTVFERTDIVGPRISAYLLRTSYIVGAVAIVLILLYTTFRFKFRFGVAAIVALVHDVLIVVSFISFFGKEMDTYILAAILTIIGYSLNDTIVVFDRARENLKSQKAYDDYESTINTSINQSLSRTAITSLTTLLVLVALIVFGGMTMRGFAFALIVGVIAGTYSSMFVASALVVDWHRWKPEKVKKL
ncbi:MAG: protein translocase subunit SecF [Spirochaetes bacterium]|nr:protein translocase subunit SecF [Spirochaetota bacterium]